MIDCRGEMSGARCESNCKGICFAWLAHINPAQARGVSRALVGVAIFPELKAFAIFLGLIDDVFA